jgi:hypothetical protein
LVGGGGGEDVMPKVRAERLREIGRTLLVANGVPEAEAATVARHCVSANLAGHDSHGVIQIPGYIDRVKAGHIVPGAPFAVVRESPTTAVVDGNWGFGYVVNERAMRLVIEKARTANLAAATVFRQGHVGRLATYPLMAAEAGMIGMAWADSGARPRRSRPSAGGKRGSAPTRGPSPSLRPPGPALPRHGDLGRRGGQGEAGRGARRADPARLGGGQRRPAHRPTRRASAAAARCCRSAAPARATKALASRW